MKYQAPIGAADPNDPYIDGDASTGTPGSPVPAKAIEHPMREIDNAISAGGLVPDDDNVTQLAAAIKKQIDAVRRNKNAIVDGRFDHWLEGISQVSSGYGSDTMWLNNNGGSTKINTRENLVLGVDIPDVPTAEFYSRTVVSSLAGASNQVSKAHRIENVRSFAGKTVTVSLYARADSPKDIAIEFVQNFGSGGSASVVGIGAQKISLTTSFQRFEMQVSIPDIIGKTISSGSNLHLAFWFDAGSNFNSITDSLGQQSGTFDIACVQVEGGAKATKFEEEVFSVSLARVQRYYFEYSNAGLSDNIYLLSPYVTGALNTSGSVPIYFPIEMRIAPTVSVVLSSGIPNRMTATTKVVVPHVGSSPSGIAQSVISITADARL